jgi:hypothetical protein
MNQIATITSAMTSLRPRRPRGLPDGVTFEDFVNMVAGHVGAELGTFEDDLNDDDFKLAALTFNDCIRRHINFLDAWFIKPGRARYPCGSGT